MLSYEEALNELLQATTTLGIETVSLQDALNRTLATSISARLDHPPFPQSAMDGFAISAPTDALNFSIQGAAYAGDHLPPPLDAGEAYKVATGGPIPFNSFAIVPIEDANVEGPSLSLSSKPTKGRWIRQRGMDVKQGESLIAAHTKLSAGCLSNLAQQGIQEVETFKTPTIGILTTGDEVCSIDVPRPDHQIFNSNQTLLKALLQQTEARVGQCLHAPDSAQNIEKSLKELSKNHDLILTTGGASVGERDHLVDVLRDSGDLQFWKVKMRPGKPVFAGRIENTPVLGLPGNPVSTFASFHLFARPAIGAITGVETPQLRWTWVPSPIDVRPHPQRRDFLRACWKSRLTTSEPPYILASGQTSGHGRDLLATDLLIEIPSIDERQIEPGELVRAFFL